MAKKIIHNKIFEENVSQDIICLYNTIAICISSLTISFHLIITKQNKLDIYFRIPKSILNRYNTIINRNITSGPLLTHAPVDSTLGHWVRL